MAVRTVPNLVIPYLVDATDNTKRILIQNSGATTGTTLTLVNQQTTSQILNFPNITGTDTITTLSTPQTFSSKNLNANNCYIVDGTDATKKIGFSISGNTTGIVLTIASQQSTAQTLSFPNITSSDTFVVLGLQQTLTNKYLTNNSCYFTDGTDITKKVTFQSSAATTSTILTIVNQQTTSQSLSIPNISGSDTIVTLAATQTLTNKTLTSTTNTIRATQLATTGSDVVISGGAPGTVGGILTLGSATTASWQSPTGASSSVWALGGNNVQSLQALGTLTAYDLPFCAGNNEHMRLTQGGSLLVGTTTANTGVQVQATGISQFGQLMVPHQSYSTGTASQLGYTITGVGTNFNSAMIGGLLIFANGVTTFITAFTSTTIITGYLSQTVSSQAYTIYYYGVQMDNWGNICVSNIYVDNIYDETGSIGTAGQVMSATGSSSRWQTLGGGLPTVNQYVYVTLGGSDSSGNGSINFPYATITQAMTSITTASPTNRFVIMVGPGTYTANISLKTDVFIVGTGVQTTRITGNIDINDVSWNSTSNDDRSGIIGVNISGTAIINFTTNTSSAGKFYIYSSAINGLLTMIAYNAINQVFCNNTLLYASFSQTGCQHLFFGSVDLAGGAIVNSSTYCATILYSYNSTFTGNLTGTYTSSNTVTMDLYNTGVAGTLTLSGASLTCNATADAISITPSISGGAVLNRLSDVVSLTATQTLTNKTLTAPVISSIYNGGTLTLPTGTDTLVGQATTDTLSNKTLSLPTISQIYNGGGTLTLPTSTDTLVGRATTDTLTNKTLTNPVISTIINTGTLTFPTSTDTLVGRSTFDLMTNKSFWVSSNTYSTGTVSQSTTVVTGVSTVWTTAMIGGLIVYANGVQAFITGFTSATSLTVVQSQTVTSQNYIIYYGGQQEDNTGNMCTAKASYSQASTTIIYDGTTPTKQLTFALSSATASTVLTLAGQQTTSQTLSIPNVSSGDSFVTLNTTQTLANKTLTAPVIGAATGTSLTLSGLTASQAVVTNASKVLTSMVYTNAATASTISQRDANANIQYNNVIQNQTSTATAGGTTTLTVSSTQQQNFTGTSNQTITLPVTSTLVLNQSFQISNLGTGILTVNSSGGNVVTYVAAGTSVSVYCTLLSGTTAASWNVPTNAGSNGGLTNIILGDSNIETTADANSGLMILTQYSLSQAATIQSMSIYVASYTSGQSYLGVYNDNTGNPGTLQATTGVFTPAVGWNTIPVTTTLLLTPGVYWIAILSSSTNIGIRRANNGYNGRSLTQTFGALPTTYSTAGQSVWSYAWSVFATLTACGSNTEFPINIEGNNVTTYATGTAYQNGTTITGTSTTFPTGLASGGSGGTIVWNYYSTGTASQSGTTITGVGTTWTSAMANAAGNVYITFANGWSSVITGFTSTTSLTSSSSSTVSSQAYVIYITANILGYSGSTSLTSCYPSQTVSSSPGLAYTIYYTPTFSTTSQNYVPITNASITIGITGNYKATFTCSANINNTSGFGYIAIFVNGVLAKNSIRVCATATYNLPFVTCAKLLSIPVGSTITAQACVSSGYTITVLSPTLDIISVL